MIIKYHQIKDATNEQLAQIRKDIFDAKEMMCVIFCKYDLRKGVTIFEDFNSLICTHNSISVFCRADVVLYNDFEGSLIEVKNRNYTHSTLKLTTDLKIEKVGIDE